MFTELVIDFTHLEEWCAEQTIFGEALLSDEYKVVRQEYRAVPLTTAVPIHLASIKTDLVISHRIQLLRESRSASDIGKAIGNFRSAAMGFIVLYYSSRSS